MNWDAVGAIGEIVGAVAVVVTLAYLARQTRMNTAAVMAQAERATWLAFGDVNMQIASDADLARIFLKSMDTPMSEWDDVDWLRLQMFARSEADKMYDIYRQWKHGLFDATEANGLLDFMRSLLEFPAWRLWWDDEKRIRAFHPDFVQNIDSREPTPIGMTRLDEIRRIADKGGAARGAHR